MCNHLIAVSKSQHWNWPQSYDSRLQLEKFPVLKLQATYLLPGWEIQKRHSHLGLSEKKKERKEMHLATCRPSLRFFVHTV